MLGSIIKPRRYSANVSPTLQFAHAPWPPVPDGCVLYLPGEPGSGATITDVSGQENDGTITGATWVRTAQGLQGLDFDGIDDLVNCGSDSSIDNPFDGGGTWECWVDLDSGGEGGVGRLISKTESYLRVTSEAAGKVKLDFVTNWDGSPSFKEFLTTNTEVTLNLPTHIAVTYNSDAAANNAILYVDGAVKTAPGSTNPGGTRDSDAAFDMIIGNNSIGSATTEGIIYLVRETPSILTGDVIANHFQQERYLFGR